RPFDILDFKSAFVHPTSTNEFTPSALARKFGHNGVGRRTIRSGEFAQLVRGMRPLDDIQLDSSSILCSASSSREIVVAIVVASCRVFGRPLWVVKTAPEWALKIPRGPPKGRKKRGRRKKRANNKKNPPLSCKLGNNNRLCVS